MSNWNPLTLNPNPNPSANLHDWRQSRQVDSWTTRVIQMGPAAVSENKYRKSLRYAGGLIVVRVQQKGRWSHLYPLGPATCLRDLVSVYMLRLSTGCSLIQRRWDSEAERLFLHARRNSSLVGCLSERPDTAADVHGITLPIDRRK